MSCLIRWSIQSDHKSLSRKQLERVRKLPLLCDNVGRKGAERLSYIDDSVTLLHSVGTLRHCKACEDADRKFSQLVLAAQTHAGVPVFRESRFSRCNMRALRTNVT